MESREDLREHMVQESGHSPMTMRERITARGDSECGKNAYVENMANDVQLRPQPVNLALMLAEHLDTWVPACERKGVVLEASCDEEAEGVWFAEPDVIRYILTNLMGNAVEFTPAGKISCTLSVSGGVSGTSQLMEWCIRDTGVGVSRGELDALLETSVVTHVDYAGTRIADCVSTLTVCARLARMMGGTLQAESVLGKGTEFWLSIPMERLNQDADLVPDQSTFDREWIVVSKGVTLSAATRRRLRLRTLTAPQAISSVSYEDSVIWLVQDERDLESCIQAARRAENPEGWYVFLPRKDYARMSPWCRAVGIDPYIKPVVASHVFSMVKQKLSRGLSPEKNRSMHATVLVAEDNQVCSTVLSAVLRRWGCQFSVTTNGRDVLSVLASDPSRYDVILMNCEMPVMDGYLATQIMRSMKDEYPVLGEIVVIGMTSGLDASVMARALASGMDDCLMKPLQFHDLFEVMARHLEKGRVVR